MIGLRTLKSFLNKSKTSEKKHDWLKAANLYEKALSSFGFEDSSKAAEIYERKGFCFSRAAFQAGTRESFKNRMEKAAQAYEEAAELLGKIRVGRKTTRIDCCKAKAVYASSLTAEIPSRKNLLDKCLRLNKTVLKNCEETGNRLGYGRVCNEMLEVYSIHKFPYVSNWPELEQVAEETLDFGENAIVMLSETRNEYELARAYCWTSYCYSWVTWLGALKENRKEFIQRCLSYSTKALTLAKKVEDPYLIGISNLSAGVGTAFVAGNLHSARKLLENQQELGTTVKDNFLTGTAAMWLAITTWLEMITLEEDPDRQREGFTRATEYAETAIRHLEIIYYYPFVIFAYYPYVECFTRLAYVETDREAKRILLERAIEVGQQGLEYAKGSDCLFFTRYVLSALSIALYWLSKIETKLSERKRLLEEALEQRKRAISIEEKICPFDYWTRGDSQNYRALIEAELAEMEDNKEEKRKLLEKAVSSIQSCLEFATKDAKERPQLWKSGSLGRFQSWSGEVLSKLYLLTKDNDVLERAINVYKCAMEAYGRIGQPSREAESCWKLARIHESIGDHQSATRNYGLASEKYRLAAEKIPQLKEFYGGYSFYMQAWSEIQKARNHHARQDYGSAKEHYEKAAAIHKTLQQWDYLAANYSAWAHVEDAENLSRHEQGEEALNAFEHAVRLFNEAQRSLQTKLSKIENVDERTMATKLVKATGLRREYCVGRMALEEAKILDKRGDHYSSSEKYGAAAATFEKILQALESEQDRKEFKLILTLSRAWQKMTQAEAETSPELYNDASRFFEEARELSPNEKSKTLALGHSRFCKALEAGTKFADTRASAEHTIAVQHLESAANYYIKAGFEPASEYTKATKLLFDAYMYMDNAERETDPDKKAKLFAMTEKLLQTSANSYMKAEHPEKREQVLRLVEKVKEERELALSLSEVLHAPSIVSTTTAFTTPNPNYEKAVGLERFEHAYIQARVIIPQKTVQVGEDFAMEIELVNTGIGPAQLIKLAEVIPQGFEVTEKPEIYRVEDSFLNMKGRRLDPLKTEEIKLALKPKVKGVFPLKPKILYLDENGNCKSHEPKSIEITVRELGIKGWLRGER